MVGIFPLLSLKSPPVWQWLYRGFCVGKMQRRVTYGRPLRRSKNVRRTPATSLSVCIHGTLSLGEKSQRHIRRERTAPKCRRFSTAIHRKPDTSHASWL